VELGGNDGLRGLDPQVTYDNLDAVLTRLGKRQVPVLLAGMYAQRNLGPDYVVRFDAMYPELAKKYGLVLYPFFLDGVATDRVLNQPDGLHPTAQGVDAIVARMLPQVLELVTRVKQSRH
jgi:acyl-CoA thioesterase-1